MTGSQIYPIGAADFCPSLNVGGELGPRPMARYFYSCYGGSTAPTADMTLAALYSAWAAGMEDM